MTKAGYAAFARWLAELPSLPLYCILANLRMLLRGRKIRIAPHEASGIMIVTDGQSAIHICRRGRYLRYKRSIAAGIAGLAGDYHLHKLEGL
jgi:hypothetical protein